MIIKNVRKRNSYFKDIILCFMFFLYSMLGFSQINDDFFSNIAKQPFGVRNIEEMEIPGPHELKNTQLKWNGDDTVASMNKIDSKEELQEELERMRQKYQPFLMELYPQLQSPRISQRIDKMQFRLETENDRNDFNYIVEGKGDWQEVSIPHYTGPGEQAIAWYRTTFFVSKEMKSKGRLVLHFNGVEYFADAFVNGQFVGNHEGYFGAFECDFSPYAKLGENILLVKVRNSSRFTVGSTPTGETSNRKLNIPRTFGDKLQSGVSLGWNEPHFGWNCSPNGFGINQNVYIEARAERYISDVFPRPILKENSVIVSVELENLSEQNGKARLKASVFGRNFKATVAENIKINCNISGTRPIYRIEIPIENPRLWKLDEPWLYQVQVKLEDDKGNLLDTSEKQFGMRSFEQRLDTKPIGRYYLNGKEIRLRGANDMGSYQLDVFRKDWKQLIDDILLAKITNMNFLRCTQTVMPQEFYDYCDRLGFLAQSDLPLFSKLSYKKVMEAIKQSSEMSRAVRSHPSNCVVSFINEPDGGDGTGGHAFAVNRGELEEFFKAAAIAVKFENPDQVIKLIDGDYNPPSVGMPDNHCYSGWYGNHCISNEKLHDGYWCKVKKGWMYGCGEFGVEGLDPINTMLKYYPKEWVTINSDGTWDPNKIEGSQTWNKHAEWYETPNTMEEWVLASQIHQANIIKIKTEAFRRMSQMNTFAIHLFIDAWPNGWLKTIMDVQRQPKLAWYTYRDALTPIAVQVRSPRNKTMFKPGATENLEIWICNDTHETPECEIKYQLELDNKVIQTGAVLAIMPTVTEGSYFQGFLPISIPDDITKSTSLKLRVSLINKQNSSIIDQYVFDANKKELRM